MHWKTLAKILGHSEPPGYRQGKERPKRKIGPFLGWIEEVLRQDRKCPNRKQRHTAKRIFERLRAEKGYTGGYTAVKDLLREMEKRQAEVFIPLEQPPGVMQVDFGEALVRIGGRLQKAHLFVMASVFSDTTFAMAFERECTETFWEGHVRGMAFLKGVPRELVYDNTRVAVRAILGRERKLTVGFLQLASHYLFGYRFCNPARGNEKGVVEGSVRFVRLNFMVPVPSFESFAALNAHLLESCRADLQRRVRGKTRTKGELLEEERKGFAPLPPTPFDACRKGSAFASSLALVRFDGNDYSVPSEWAHQSIQIKGYYDRVKLLARGREVAVHPRIWDKEQVRFEPMHYLAVLERKPGALDFARPLAGWALPEPFANLRRRLEAEFHGNGTREYIRVLRLMENHPVSEVRRAVEQALQTGAITRDAVAQFLWPQEPWSLTTFCLDGHPHLRGVKVQTPNLRPYSELLAAAGGAA
jgi:transposase